MTDEIRIYHHDDPNDAPDRRLGAFPTINPFLPTSLPQYVIEPVANSLYSAMQYYWYTAYQQGIAAQRQQQQQAQQQQQQQQQHLHQLQRPSSSSTTTNDRLQQPQQQDSQQQQPQQQQLINDQQQQNRLTTNGSSSADLQPPSAASTAAMASSSASSSSSSSSCASSSSSRLSTMSASPRSHQHPDHDDHHRFSIHNHLHHHHHHNHHRSQSVSSVEQEQLDRPESKHNNGTSNGASSNQEHIKKPLNPFMIFMQKQRPEIVRQGDMKESAAINKHLGQLWRQLSREEQEPYYKLAEQEKLLHAQKYPGWSARDNYANQKKRKKMKLKAISLNGLDQSDKKCRARFGLQNMASWCKPCKRKKKCIYSMPSRHHHSHNHGSNSASNSLSDNPVSHLHTNHHQHQLQHNQQQLQHQNHLNGNNHHHHNPLQHHHNQFQPHHYLHHNPFQVSDL